MGLFAVDYKSVEGQGVYAYGGLRFRADEASLRRYFAEILPHVSLNDLIGEATFWLLLPSTIAAWVLPVLLYYLDISVAIYSTAGIYLVAAVSHFLVYSKPVNYLVLLFSQRVPRLFVYAGWVTLLLLKGLTTKAVTLGAFYLFLGFGLEGRIFASILAPLYACSSSCHRRIRYYEMSDGTTRKSVESIPRPGGCPIGSKCRSLW